MSGAARPFTIRRLLAEDAEAFRALRLASLADAPTAFGSSVADEADQPLAFFIDRIAAPEPSAIFGAFLDHTLVGMARFVVGAGEKRRHVGSMTAVAVLASHRGRGIATALVTRVIEHARGHVLTLQADVTMDNEVARGLYARLGFRRYGVEPRALLVDGRFVDKELIVLDLDAR